MDWMEHVPQAPLEWLLERENPSVRALALTELLDRDAEDEAVVEARQGIADAPYAAHILQLAAYCLLVEETYERRPPYGVILYAAQADQAFEIDYTSVLEEELLAILDEMRQALVEGDAPRDHDHFTRCQACNYRGGCDQSLA